MIGLYGNLGAGKTTLVRGIAAGLGVSPRTVSSPTFVLIHEYAGRVPLAHVDLYRIRSQEELAGLGFSDYVNGKTGVVVEWAEHAGPELGQDFLAVSLSHRTEQTRSIRLRATGPRAAGLLSLIRTRHRRARSRPVLVGRKKSSRPAHAGAA